jgi:hypothetical protein
MKQHRYKSLQKRERIIWFYRFSFEILIKRFKPTNIFQDLQLGILNYR